MRPIKRKDAEVAKETEKSGAIEITRILFAILFLPLRLRV